MKTLKHKEVGNLKRRPDKEARKMVDTDKWEYVTKSVWKEQVRDVEKEPTVNEETGKMKMVTKKSNKMSKSTKRHMRKTNK